jgi:hypothetical protein
MLIKRLTILFYPGWHVFLTVMWSSRPNLTVHEFHLCHDHRGSKETHSPNTFYYDRRSWIGVFLLLVLFLFEFNRCFFVTGTLPFWISGHHVWTRRRCVVTVCDGQSFTWIDRIQKGRVPLIYESLLSISLRFLLSQSPQPLGSSQVGAPPLVLLSDCTLWVHPRDWTDNLQNHRGSFDVLNSNANTIPPADISSPWRERGDTHSHQFIIL